MATLERSKINYYKNREHVLAKQRARRATPEGKRKHKAINDRWRSANKDRISQLHKAYYAKPEVRARMRQRAGLPEPTRPPPDGCEACGKPPSRSTLDLDHDHDTNEFRGWLCSDCNLGLGKLGDTIEGVEKLLEYIKRYTATRAGQTSREA